MDSLGREALGAMISLGTDVVATRTELTAAEGEENGAGSVFAGLGFVRGAETSLGTSPFSLLMMMTALSFLVAWAIKLK